MQEEVRVSVDVLECTRKAQQLEDIKKIVNDYCISNDGKVSAIQAVVDDLDR